MADRGHSKFVLELSSILLTILIFIQTGCQCLAQDPCQNVISNSDQVRDVTQYHGDSDQNCDKERFLPTRWYSFTLGGEPAVIPTRCIQSNRCGATIAMRIDLDGQSMPEEGANITAFLCGAYNVLGRYDCCVLRSRVSIARCKNQEFVYKFHDPIDRCPASICTQVFTELDQMDIDVEDVMASHGQEHIDYDDEENQDLSNFVEEPEDNSLIQEDEVAGVTDSTSSPSAANTQAQTDLSTLGSGATTPPETNITEATTNGVTAFPSTSFSHPDANTTTTNASDLNSSNLINQTTTPTTSPTISPTTSPTISPTTDTPTNQRTTSSAGNQTQDGDVISESPSLTTTSSQTPTSSSSSSTKIPAVQTTETDDVRITNVSSTTDASETWKDPNMAKDISGGASDTTSTSTRSPSPSSSAITTSSATATPTVTPTTTTTATTTRPRTTVFTITSTPPTTTTTATTTPTTITTIPTTTRQTPPPPTPTTTTMTTTTATSTTTMTGPTTRTSTTTTAAPITTPTTPSPTQQSSSTPSSSSSSPSSSSPSSLQSTTLSLDSSSSTNPSINRTPGDPAVIPDEPTDLDLVVIEKVRLVFAGAFLDPEFGQEVAVLVSSFIAAERSRRQAETNGTVSSWFEVTTSSPVVENRNETTRVDLTISHAWAQEMLTTFEQGDLTSFMLEQASWILLASCRPKQDCLTSGGLFPDPTTATISSSPPTPSSSSSGADHNTPVLITISTICAFCVILMVAGVVCAKCRRRRRSWDADKENQRAITGSPYTQAEGTPSPFTDVQIMSDEEAADGTVGMNGSALDGGDVMQENSWVVPLEEIELEEDNDVVVAQTTEDTKF